MSLYSFRSPFLSTPPSRVATRCRWCCLKETISFYPRHPRGWRHRQGSGQGSSNRVSIHATLAGGDSVSEDVDTATNEFLSTPPSRVATVGQLDSSHAFYVSIHATLAGGDVVEISSGSTAHLFLSTPPSRVATARDCGAIAYPFGFYPRHPRGWRPGGHGQAHGMVCFYPRHPRGWRQMPFGYIGIAWFVSIHATLAGGDNAATLNIHSRDGFYPRHPRGWRPDHQDRGGGYRQSFYPRHPRGWRRCRLSPLSSPKQFLSTPPPRVATLWATAIWTNWSNFYPRHPRGWRRSEHNYSNRGWQISIHATPAGGDAKQLGLGACQAISIHATPAGGDHAFAVYNPPGGVISIHATPAGGDAAWFLPSISSRSFLSTPPPRVATGHTAAPRRTGGFLSTPPPRVAT